MNRIPIEVSCGEPEELSPRGVDRCLDRFVHRARLATLTDRSKRVPAWWCDLWFWAPQRSLSSSGPSERWLLMFKPRCRWGREEAPIPGAA